MDAVNSFALGLARAVRWLPDWLLAVAGFALALGLALLADRMLTHLLTRLTANRDMFWRSLVKRTAWARRLGLVVGFFWFASAATPLTTFEAAVAQHALLLCLIALAVVAARTALHIWLTLYLRRFKLDSEDNLLARKHVTQSRILERIAVTLLVIVGLAAALMTFDDVAQYGVSLLASAGAAGIVVGLALQPILKNIFAGLQLAITQPIRIDDALLVEGEWGNVEEITSTYVVVRIWDWRRLILPLSYFIEHPFQNWTREGAAIIGVVMIYLDYAVPLAQVRERVESFVRASPLWDGKVVAVQITDFREFTAEVRILTSARTSGRAFDLRCQVREALVTWLQQEHPEALPRLRTEMLGPGPSGSAAAAAGLHVAAE